MDEEWDVYWVSCGMGGGWRDGCGAGLAVNGGGCAISECQNRNTSSPF